MMRHSTSTVITTVLMIISRIRSLSSYCIHGSKSYRASRLATSFNGNNINNNAEFLLGSTLKRAQRVLLSNIPDNVSAKVASQDKTQLEDEFAVTSLLGTASKRAEQILHVTEEAKTTSVETSFHVSTNKTTKQQSYQHTDYGKNPAITTTALAHLLWSHVLQDVTHTTVIDATAGNGNDSVVLSQLLFSNDQSSDGAISSNRLLCLDVQERACQVTRQRLTDLLPGPIFQNNVQVLQQSHASFPLAHDEQVSLVVYNLGYLPNSTHLEGGDAPDKMIKTNTESTLNSLMNAAMRIRVGGMLSVMTYPKSDAVEDAAVQAFCQGLALFSSQTHDWRQLFECNDSKDPVVSLSPLLEATVQQQLRHNLETVLQSLGRNTTWRVQEYRKMGWVDAPILITAFRIK